MMINKFDEVDVKSLSDNVFQLLDEDWMLITAGKKDSFNTMTASWGFFGIMWQKPVAVVFIRPHRHTFGFVENNPSFTLSFFTQKYKNVLNYCGQKSGREFDKVKETGITPIYLPTGNVSFAEARMVLDCKKLYSDEIKAGHFIDKSIIHRLYPEADFHKMYMAEITNCYLLNELK